MLSAKLSTLSGFCLTARRLGEERVPFHTAITQPSYTAVSNPSNPFRFFLRPLGVSPYNGCPELVPGATRAGTGSVPGRLRVLALYAATPARSPFAGAAGDRSQLPPSRGPILTGRHCKSPLAESQPKRSRIITNKRKRGDYSNSNCGFEGDSDVI
jgi:hypothetical protein